MQWFAMECNSLQSSLIVYCKRISFHLVDATADGSHSLPNERLRAVTNPCHQLGGEVRRRAGALQLRVRNYELISLHEIEY